jgi:hypothetical protein
MVRRIPTSNMLGAILAALSWAAIAWIIYLFLRMLSTELVGSTWTDSRPCYSDQVPLRNDQYFLVCHLHYSSFSQKARKGERDAIPDNSQHIGIVPLIRSGLYSD